MSALTGWSRYRELVGYSVFADLRAETARNHLGLIWWVIDPLLYMAVLYLVFGVLPIRERPEDFVWFLLTGLVVWRWFQRSVASGCMAVINNRSVMQLTYLPKVVFPVTDLLSNFVKYAIVQVLLIVALVATGHPVTSSYWCLPLLIMTQFILSASLVLFLAAIMPLVPDFKFLVDNTLQLMFFVSGVFFAASSLDVQYQTYVYFNPVAVLIEAFRDVLVYARTPDLVRVSWILGLSILACVPGLVIFARLDRQYPKLVADK